MCFVVTLFALDCAIDVTQTVCLVRHRENHLNDRGQAIMPMKLFEWSIVVCVPFTWLLFAFLDEFQTFFCRKTYLKCIINTGLELPSSFFNCMVMPLFLHLFFEHTVARFSTPSMKNECLRKCYSFGWTAGRINHQDEPNINIVLSKAKNHHSNKMNCAHN